MDDLRSLLICVRALALEQLLRLQWGAGGHAVHLVMSWVKTSRHLPPLCFRLVVTRFLALPLSILRPLLLDLAAAAFIIHFCK